MTSLDHGPVAGEPSWERLTRIRREIKHLRDLVAEETPSAIIDARNAGVTTRDLAKAWGVTESWLYKIIKQHQSSSDAAEGENTHS